MQKKQKYIVVICCAVLLVSSLSLLIKGTVGGAEGKFFDIFTVPDTLTIPTKTFSYKITYTNAGIVLYSKEITMGQGVDETTLAGYHASALEELKVQMAADTEGTYDGVEFSYWMNAGSSEVTSIPDGNTEDIELYPKFDKLYTAMFVNQDGSLLAWCFFSSANYSDKVTDAESEAYAALPDLGEDFVFEYWKVKGTGIDEQYAIDNFKNYTTDVTIYPYYTYNGAASLIPIDSDGDGDTDYYQVDGYSNGEGSKLVEIPGEVNGVPVTTINADAFASYDDLTAVRIPANVEIIEGAVFSDSTWSRQTVTLYYEGSPEQWAQYMTEVYTDGNYEHLASNWDYALGDGSRVFFLDEDGKVDTTAGYWELYKGGNFWNPTYTWIFHDHEYLETHPSDCSENSYVGGFTDYDATDRVDAIYWTEE